MHGPGARLRVASLARIDQYLAPLGDRSIDRAGGVESGERQVVLPPAPHPSQPQPSGPIDEYRRRTLVLSEAARADIASPLTSHRGPLTTLSVLAGSRGWFAAGGGSGRLHGIGLLGAGGVKRAVSSAIRAGAGVIHQVERRITPRARSVADRGAPRTPGRAARSRSGGRQAGPASGTGLVRPPAPVPRSLPWPCR